MKLPILAKLLEQPMERTDYAAVLTKQRNVPLGIAFIYMIRSTALIFRALWKQTLKSKS